MLSTKSSSFPSYLLYTYHVCSLLLNGSKLLICMRAVGERKERNVDQQADVILCIGLELMASGHMGWDKENEYLINLLRGSVDLVS